MTEFQHVACPLRARYGGQERLTTVNDEGDDQGVTCKGRRWADRHRPLIDIS
jgi:hypothetical protein